MSKLVRQASPRPPVWTSQPQVPVGVDWSNPITRGLIFAATANDTRNLCDGVALNTTASPISRSPADRGMVISAGAARYPEPANASAPAAKFDIHVLTALVFANQSATQNNNFAFFRGNGSSTPSWMVGLHSGTYHAPIGAVGSAYFQPTVPGDSLGAGWALPPHVVVLRADGADAELFADGKLIKSGAYTPPTHQYSAGRGVYFGSVNATNGQQTIRPRVALLWNRPLSDAELASISANPWQIFKPLVKQYPFDLVRGPAQRRESYMLGTTPPALSQNMPAAVMRRVWTSQPQVPVGVDWSNPLCVGLLDGFLHPARSLKGLPITGALPIGAGLNGMAIVSASSSSVQTISGLVSPQSTAMTVLLIARRDGAQPDSGFGTTLLMTKTAGTADPFVHFIKSGTVGERIRLNTGTDDDTSNYWETSTDWPVGVWQVGTYVFSSGSAPTMYRNGIAQTLSASGGTLSGSLKASSSAQINLATLRLNGAVGGVIVWNRALSAAEVKAISANPWQIFNPLNQTIMVPA